MNGEIETEHETVGRYIGVGTNLVGMLAGMIGKLVEARRSCDYVRRAVQAMQREPVYACPRCNGSMSVRFFENHEIDDLFELAKTGRVEAIYNEVERAFDRTLAACPRCGPVGRVLKRVPQDPGSSHAPN